MVVDTSALIAILNNEPERDRFLTQIEAAERCYISSLCLYEARIVALARFGEIGLRELELLVGQLDISSVPFDGAQVDASTDAYHRFGKGIGSPGVLNLCDCAAYALAQMLNVPLLFKGHDFSATDVVIAG